MREIGEAFYRGFLAADADALARLVAPEASLALGIETALGRTHRGPTGIAGLRAHIAELTDGTWQPLRADSHDIAASEWHAVVMDRYLASRAGARLDSHEAIVLAVDDGTIVRLFHYAHDPEGFQRFWG